MKISLTLALLCISIHSISGYNILVVMPLPSFSHTNSFMPIFTELAKRGHNVTMVSPFPQEKPIPNFKDIVIKRTTPKFQGNEVAHDVRKFNFLITLFGVWPMCRVFLDPVFALPEFKEFLNDKHMKFDLVILEVFFCQTPLLALGQKYNAPVVSVVVPIIDGAIAHVSGNPNPTAYVPTNKFALSDHMTFWERVKNTFIAVLEIIVEEFYGFPQTDRLMKEYLAGFPGFDNLPPASEMMRNISLYMLDNHYTLSYPRPYQPNVVEFGGLSIKQAPKLPTDLEKYINESKDGVIFFTWGSHYPMTHMKPELRSTFMSVFSKLKQRVLMKWEEETLPGKPDNVKISRWFPQSSILSHPNVRLFISHGGLHGVTEAIYYSMPILGTPLFADQGFNLRIAETAGMALSIDIDTVTEEELFITMKKLLDDPKFKENAVKKSLIMKDRPLSALDNAVYWVEYVLRHNGARHLRPGSLDLAWYQNLLLDVIAASLAILIVTLLLLKHMVMFLFNRICKRKSKDSNKKSKKE